MSLALGPCDSFTESSWSEVWTPAPEAAQNTEVGVQTERKETDRDRIEEAEEEDGEFEQVPRDVAECLRVMNAAADTETGTKSLLDSEIISLVEKKHIPGHQLEKALGDPSRGVRVRRKIYMKHGNLKRAMESLPYQHYDYSKVMGACCENVVGYMPVPVGVVGPLNMDNDSLYVPMATTEGCLVASTNRGCRAVAGCGVTTRVTYDGMTRGPVVRFPCMARATEAKEWMGDRNNFESIKQHFDSTSRFARLQRLHTRIAGRMLYIRYKILSSSWIGSREFSQ